MDRGKLQALTSRAAKLLEQWTQAQGGAILLIGNFGNLLQRIPHLTAPDNFAGLCTDDQDLAHLQRRVLAKQLGSLNTVLERLKTSMDEMADAVRGQEKLCQEAWAVLGAAPSAASCAVAIGAVASPAHMVEAMEDTWCMCRDEVCLKTAITFQLHPGMADSEFQELHTLFCASVNIRARHASYLALQSNALAVERA